MSTAAVNSINTIDPMTVPVGAVYDLLGYGITLVFGPYRLVPDLEERTVEVQEADNDEIHPWISYAMADLDFSGVLFLLELTSELMKEG